MNTMKPFALGSIAVATALHLTSVHADLVCDSFDRDLNRVTTRSDVTAVASITDELQRAVNSATWTHPGQQVLQSNLRDPRLASNGFHPTTSAAAPVDRDAARAGRSVQAERRDTLAPLASH